MPAFKNGINESGTNLEDALNKTRWAHWVFKTNIATKAKMKTKRKVDPLCDSDSDEEILYPRVVIAEDCPCKDTYTFPEYETFVDLHAHPLLSREMSTSSQGSTKKAKDKTRLIKERVKIRKDQRQEENERKEGIRREFEDTRASKRRKRHLNERRLKWIWPPTAFSTNGACLHNPVAWKPQLKRLYKQKWKTYCDQ
jgi:hypothetical protein